MPSSLLEIWRHQPSLLEGKTFRQIIQFTGEGRLLDRNTSSREVREWLAAIPLDRLRLLANECLLEGFDDSGHALQDIVNQLGVRLGFDVEPGLYRGVKGSTGNDGLWVAKDHHAFVVEVKTSDTYRINLDTLDGYRKALAASGRVNQGQCSILIAVGRQDTGDLEAQIRGSRLAWDVRLVSIEALIRLAAIKEQLNDWTTSNRINRVLRPVEYTRVDGIVELLFATSQDLETPEPGPPREPQTVALSSRRDGPGLEAAREKAVSQLADHLGVIFVRKGRALRSASDATINLVCVASQRYEGPGGSANYWYGITPAQCEFVREAPVGWFAFVCADSARVFLVSRDELLCWLPEMLTTPPKPASPSDIRHWHIYFNDYGTRIDLKPAAGGQPRDLLPYLV